MQICCCTVRYEILIHLFLYSKTVHFTVSLDRGRYRHMAEKITYLQAMTRRFIVFNLDRLSIRVSFVLFQHGEVLACSLGASSQD